MQKSNLDLKSRTIFLAATLGLNFAVGMALFAFLGYTIDEKRGGGGQAFTLGGIFMGFFYGGYELWKAIKQIQKDDEKK